MTDRDDVADVTARYEECRWRLDGGGLPIGMDPQHRADVAVLMRHSAALEAIVRDLATGYVEAVQGHDDESYCTLCDGATDEQPEHEPTCPWRRAVEWVAGQGTDTGDPE